MSEEICSVDRLIESIALRIQQADERQLKSIEADVTPEQLRILQNVMHSKTGSMGEVARSSGIAPSTLTADAGVLIKKGLLMRRNSSRDKRIYCLALSAKAKSILKQIDANRNRILLTIKEQFSETDFSQLSVLLNQLLSGYQKTK